MTPSDDELIVARSWIGTTEDEDVFIERCERLGSLDSAIVESLRAQLASLVLDSPASVSTPSGLSINQSENIKALQASLEEFLSIGGTDGIQEEDVSSGSMTVVIPIPRRDYR